MVRSPPVVGSVRHYTDTAVMDAALAPEAVGNGNILAVGSVTNAVPAPTVCAYVGP
jgi:hypothetical protein